MLTFFTAASPTATVLPAALVLSAVEERGVAPDDEGYTTFERSPVAGGLALRVRPVAISRRELEAERKDEFRTLYRRYPHLDDVRIESRVMSFIDVTFPCDLCAWVHRGAVYLSRRFNRAQFLRLTEEQRDKLRAIGRLS